MPIPDINSLPPHPILQALASKNSWVRVEFFGKEPPTQAEIFRTIELLCMMHNGWADAMPGCVTVNEPERDAESVQATK